MEVKMDMNVGTVQGAGLTVFEKRYELSINVSRFGVVFNVYPYS